MAYNAFISYSHTGDARLAAAIQSGLHRLAKPFYRLRALNIFRDKTSLAANPALWNAIQSALERSDYFILMASPASAQSEWVCKELGWWVAHREIRKLLIVLSAGDLGWDRARGDLDWTRTTAVSELLRGRFEDEPLYVDLRWVQQAGDLTLRNPRFLEAILDLASPLHGRAKNDLAGDEVRQSRIVRSAVGSAAVIFAVLAVIAWYQRGEALSQRQIAVERQQVAEKRLKELCAAWKVATEFVEANLPAGIYDAKGRLHDVFAFEENCR
jgi:hypothetical protein